MKLNVMISGRTRQVEVAREGSLLRCRIDGRAFDVDAVEVAPGTYSLLIGGQAFEVRVEPAPGTPGLRVYAGDRQFNAEVVDPRQWSGRRGGVLEAEGRQQVLAPMPGKIVRLLVKQGDSVRAGQGLAVIEAMKMQNDIRSPRTGTVEKLLVSEGKAVNAGEVLAVVG